MGTSNTNLWVSEIHHKDCWLAVTKQQQFAVKGERSHVRGGVVESRARPDRQAGMFSIPGKRVEKGPRLGAIIGFLAATDRNVD